MSARKNCSEAVIAPANERCNYQVLSPADGMYAAAGKIGLRHGPLAALRGEATPFGGLYEGGNTPNRGHRLLRPGGV
jgi:hypothetical protein